LPLYLSKNGDTLVLTYEYGGSITIIYNQRENRVVGRIRALSYNGGESRLVRRLVIGDSGKVCPFSHVESLVSTDWK